jgi:hypothetical protein
MLQCLSSQYIFIRVLIIVVVLTGCGTTKINVHRNVDDNNYPLSVAILPFSVNKEIAIEEQPHIIFRDVFFLYFSYLGYTDMALENVDKKLLATGLSLLNEEGLVKTHLYSRLKEILGVDAIIMGHISDATNMTGGLHAQTTMSVKLKMIDLRHETPLWDAELTEMSYAGVASPTIIDIIKDQIDNANVQQAYYRLAESLSIKVVNEIPDPASNRK